MLTVELQYLHSVLPSNCQSCLVSRVLFVLRMLVSFVPRPVLRDETLEDQQNVIEEMVDEKVECNDDDEDVKELDEISAAESSSLYSVHPSGHLTLMFRNSPQPGCSPAHSPALPFDFKSSDALCDVRVKLERCDDDTDSATATTPSKRSRIEVNYPLPLSSQDVPIQRLKSEVKSEVVLSEADAAVAGLLGSSSVNGGETATNEAAACGRQLPDMVNGFFTDSIPVQYGVLSADGFNLTESAEHFANAENGAVVTDPIECDTTVDDDCQVVTQIEASDGEIVTAVDSLMADLGQLNAEMPNAVRTFVPNGSLYLPCPVRKLSLAKRTSDIDTAVTRSFDDASLTVAGTVASIQQQPSHLDSSLLLHTSQSSPYSNWTKFATSEHESDLDTAIKSILS